jgi:hypothetical protein
VDMGHIILAKNKMKQKLLMKKKVESQYQQDSVGKQVTINYVKGDIVQGDKVSNTKKEEINAPSALIVTKNQKGGENTVNYFKNEYKSLDQSLKNQIDEKLKDLANKYSPSPEVIIEIESGNSDRNKIALELYEILKKKNMGVYSRGNTFIGRFPDSPISVFTNQNNNSFVTDLLNSLKLFIKGKFEVITNERMSNSHIRIYIKGSHYFLQMVQLRFSDISKKKDVLLNLHMKIFHYC